MFLTVIEYVRVDPVTTGSGLSVMLEIAKSAAIGEKAADTCFVAASSVTEHAPWPEQFEPDHPENL